MNYIILDLEWNQCPQGKARENPRIPFEIVEIGAIKLNEKKEVLQLTPKESFWMKLKMSVDGEYKGIASFVEKKYPSAKT